MKNSGHNLGDSKHRDKPKATEPLSPPSQSTILKRNAGAPPGEKAKVSHRKTNRKDSKMSVKLSTGAMPASNVGRKKIPLDSELLEGIVEYLRENRMQEVDGEFRPLFVGPENLLYATESRAQSAGRRYAVAAKEALGVTVKTNVFDNGETAKDKLRYLWRLYVPLSAAADEAQEPIQDAPAA